MGSPLKGYTYATITVLLWSLTALLARVLKNDADYITIVVIMMTLSLFLFGGVVISKRDKYLKESKKMKKQNLIVIIGISLFLPLYFLTYYYSLQNLPVVEANMINYLWIMVMIVLSTYVFKTIDKFNAKEWTFAVLSFVGALIVMYNPSVTFYFEKGYLITFLSVLAAGAYYSLNLTDFSKKSPSSKNAIAFLGGR